MPGRSSGLLASHLCTLPALTDTPAAAPGPLEGSLQLDSDPPGHLGGAGCQPGGGSLHSGWALRTWGGLQLSPYPRDCPPFQPRLSLNSPFANRSARRGRAPCPAPGADRWLRSSSETEGGAGRRGRRMAVSCRLDTGEAGWSPWFSLRPWQTAPPPRPAAPKALPRPVLGVREHFPTPHYPFSSGPSSPYLPYTDPRGNFEIPL